MARYGWSYMVVPRPLAPAESAAPIESPDGGRFATEAKMLDELGDAGWELVQVREEAGALRYYFKRPRA